MTTLTVLQKFRGDSVSLPRIVLTSYPLRVAAVVIAASLVIAGISFYEAGAPVMPLRYLAQAIIDGGAPAASSLAASGETFSTGSTSATEPMREVHIADDGLMLVRGATVTSIGNDTITIAIAWSGATFNWTVKTGTNTKFVTAAGEKGSPADIRAGDYIEVTGMLTQGGTEPTIAAEFVRE